MLLLVAGSGPASALSVKDIRGDCLAEYTKWRKRGGYGAFAYSRNGACGFSWLNNSLTDARSGANSACRKHSKGMKCEVVAEIDKPAAQVTQAATCRRTTGQASLEACTAYLALKNLSKLDRAWAFNSRGITYKNMGRIEAAIEDYGNAVKADRGYGWAYINRARLLEDKGQAEAALSDARASLKYYKSGGDDYRKEAKEVVDRLSRQLAAVKEMPDLKLCVFALKSDKSAFDTTPRYAFEIAEVKRRGYGFEDCREKLGYSRSPNRYETFSDANLCRESLDGSTGDWIAQPQGELQLAEIRRRNLSLYDCRGLAAKVPGTPYQAYSNKSLCELALVIWQAKGNYSKAIEEATLRGLTIEKCQTLTGRLNVSDQNKVTTSGLSSSPGLASLPDRQLCSRALEPTIPAWEDSKEYTFDIIEAGRRGLTIDDCRRLIGHAVAVTARKPDDSELCMTALNDARKGWRSTPDGVWAWAQADARGLTLSKCQEAALRTRQQVAEIPLERQADREICRLATDPRNFDWDRSGRHLNALREAGRRSLSLGDCFERMGYTVADKSRVSADVDICRLALGADQNSWSATPEGVWAQGVIQQRQLTLARCQELQAPVQTTVATPSPPPAVSRRIALVIGNSKYRHVPSLNNTDDDAALMSDVLGKAGFEVTRVNDADQAAMKRAMVEFGRALRAGADASLFYYAGHAIEVDRGNFLIPVDASIKDESEVAFQSVSLNDFLQTMEASPSQVKIVVLDSCRDNPFATAFRSLSRGLAAVNAPRGTFIAYSTSPGDVAADGLGRNSPFTAALAESILQPGLKLEDAFKLTRAKVLKATADKQLPWDSSSLTGDFYFLPAN